MIFSITTVRLTLTRVVFECRLKRAQIENNDGLTLTRVVFECAMQIVVRLKLF